MSENSPPAPNPDDLFAALVLRYLDGEITPEGLAWLTADLKTNSERRSLFVTLSALHGHLGEAMKAVAIHSEAGLVGNDHPVSKENGLDSILETRPNPSKEAGGTTIREHGENETVRIVRNAPSSDSLEPAPPKDETIRIAVPGKKPKLSPGQ
jgi:hypothetical protein